MTSIDRPGERALLAELLLQEDAIEALMELGEEELARLLGKHRREGNAELGSYLITREWFGDTANDEASAKVLELMVCVQGKQRGQPHKLVQCDSLKAIVDEIIRQTNTPFIPEGASYWVCPEGRVHDGTYVSVIGGDAICMKREPLTLKDVRFRIVRPNLARKDGARTFHTMIGEFAGTHAFVTKRPPRELRKTNTPDADCFQFRFDPVPDDGGYVPSPDEEAYALIMTRGGGPQSFTILYHAKIIAFYDGNPITVYSDNDREFVYEIPELHSIP